MCTIAHLSARTRMRSFAIVLALVLAPWCCSADESPTFSAPGTLAERGRFIQHDGAALYRAICQSCHMADAHGAHGAGMYPALAANPRLASAIYPAITVLAGRRGMPQLADSLNDQQVADVVNYIRSHFDNRYTDNLMPSDVARLRASLLSSGGSR